MVIAYALAGTLEFNPLTDALTNDEGEEVRLDPPVGEQLPDRAFEGHAYGKNSGGTLFSLPKITAEDLRNFKNSQEEIHVPQNGNN